MKKQTGQNRSIRRGFTLIEIVVVLVILSITALLAVPVFGTAADMQVRAAADKIAADLDYAKGLAVTRQKTYTVVFFPLEERYQVQDAAGTVLPHPLRSGRQFVENFSVDRRTKKVDVVSTTFSGDAVTFDYLGTPYSGTDTANRLNEAGWITIQADSFVLYVKIEPVTGYISVEKTKT
ncbi:MAG: prepilin-type N-terminal cleavage/methylation domain-containing protein [Anaerohalosphaeraceae bacterium]